MSKTPQRQVAGSNDGDDGSNDDEFAHYVSISGDYAIGGARLDDNGGNSDQGSARIFFRSGTA